MEEFLTILFTAFITAFAMNFFGYVKEQRISTSKYTECALRELYISIYKILTGRITPGDGYEGIDDEQIIAINKIIEEHPELTDPELEKIFYNIYEDAYFNWKANIESNHDYDLERELLEYILTAFNKTRKSLGLPYERKYTSRFIGAYLNLKERYKKRKYNRRLKKIKK